MVFYPKIEIPGRNLQAELELADALTVDPALAQVLYVRGVRDADAARDFLYPDGGAVTPPEDFEDLGKAADLILRVCGKAGARVFVAGDYDVDGLTATALLVLVLRQLGADVEYYIPNRLTEGYDLTADTVARAEAAGTELLITADCGSRASEAVAECRRAGMAVVVTDHHRLAETLPPADAVVSSQRLPQGHPARDFAGVGVAYKLAEEVIRRGGLDLEPRTLLPLFALGTVCDVVPLGGENRTLVAAGLREFPGKPFRGLAALMAETGTETPLRSWHLAFVIGPRLNAAGRLGHADYALELLLAEDEGRAPGLARKLEEFNRKRRKLEDEVAGPAREEGAARVAAGRRAIVLAGSGWHPGVIGIVASRVVESFNRPTVLIAVDGETGRGSCRSIPTFDIHRALDAASDYLIRYGGHRLAAGFEIATENIPAFASALEDYAAEHLDDEALRPVVRVDGAFPLNGVNAGLARDLDLLEPVGRDNPRPSFYTETYVDEQMQRVFKNAHLEISARAGAAKVRAVGFNLVNGGNGLDAGEYGLVHTPLIERWQGRERVELRLDCVVPAGAGGPARAEQVAVFDRRGEKPADVLREFKPDTDALYGLPEQEALAGGGAYLEYMGSVAPRRRWFRVWLAAPPGDPHRLAALCAAAEELVFAFGEAEALAAKEFLGRYYPGRERLAHVFRDLRENGPREIEGMERGDRRAVEIFRELGLADVSGGEVTVCDAPPSEGGPGRVSLDESSLFGRCERRRDAAEEFISGLCRWSEATLRELMRDVSASAGVLTLPPEIN
jgi:single-stranded-DNA-specific exonuclease